MQKIHIKRFSTGSMIIAGVLSVLFIALAVTGIRVFHGMREATDRYILCESSAQKLKNGSNILTDQVRLFVLTGKEEYMNAYFNEANVERSRDRAVEELKEYFPDTDIISDLEEALQDSVTLMEREIYAMRLECEALGFDPYRMPTEVADIALTADDSALSASEKLERARAYVSDSVYQNSKDKITGSVDHCMDGLIESTKNEQTSSERLFTLLYILLQLSLAVLVIFLIVDSVIVRKLIVTLLLSYNESIKQDETVPVIGAAELQSLAETYNTVFEENREAHKLIRHEAEHDALTDLLNKGSFDKILSLYKQGDTPYALVLADIDVFKSVNDTYGHAVGDDVLRMVANCLKNTFRSTDYIFRIGGDEFAVIMVNMPEKLRSVAEEKLALLRQALANASDDLPKVTMSVGIAFSDGTRSNDGIFVDADKALYFVKEHGKNGSSFV